MGLRKKDIDKFEPEAKRYVRWDEDLPGFGVRVYPGGQKSYVLYYRAVKGGRKRFHTIGATNVLTLQDARDEAKKLLGVVAGGDDPVAPSKALLTVNELCDRYLGAMHGRKSHDTMQMRIKLHVRARWGSWKVTEVQWHHVQEMHHEMAGTPYEANRVLARVRHLYNWASHDSRRYVAAGHPNPATGHELYNEKSRERWLDAIEIARLRDAVALQSRDVECAVNLLLELGCRKSELLGLSWEDVRLDRGTITYRDTKNSEDRTRPFSDAARLWLTALREWQEQVIADDKAAPVLLANLNAGYLFPSPRTEGPRDDIKRQWEAIRKDSGLQDVRMHDLRRTFGTKAHASGFPLHAVGQYLGHKSPKSTEVYARIVDDQMRNLANAVGGPSEAPAETPDNVVKLTK